MTTEKTSIFEVDHFYNLKNKSKKNEFFTVKILGNCGKNIKVLILSNGIEKDFFEDDILDYSRRISFTKYFFQLLEFNKFDCESIQFKLDKDISLTPELEKLYGLEKFNWEKLKLGSSYYCIVYKSSTHFIYNVIINQEKAIHINLIISKEKVSNGILSFQDLLIKGTPFNTIEELFETLNRFGYNINPIELVTKLTP
jgi:hypothetical protein